ncbi:peptidyl-tRNA hydrolase protein 1 [Entomortierella beljakovae]|nr:peptidyl-tRNA hydrolase protein 1 [Entomortierella beljakovae]
MIAGLGNATHPGTRHNVGMMVVDSIAERFGAEWTKAKGWQAEVATAHTTITRKSRLPPTPVARFYPGIVPGEKTPTDAIQENTESATTDENTDNQSSKRKPNYVLETIDVKITLIKPLLPMNVSGHSISRAVKELKIPLSDFMIVHDDMERDVGKISFKSFGSANGHNGIKSCAKYLKTDHFKRLRIGVGRPNTNSRTSDVISEFVLGKFKPFEIEQLKELVYEKAGDEIIRMTVTPPIPKHQQRF